MSNVSASAAVPLRSFAVSSDDPAAGIAAAAHLLLPHLERGGRIDAVTLRAAMEDAFGGSDAVGAWDWKTAYDACEAATVLFMRKFGPVIRARAGSPAAELFMLSKIAALLPTHTRRSEESQALQQFSTPLALGFVAASAAAITPADLVLEPSAGTGLLAIFAELAGSRLALNELAETRAALLGALFPSAAKTRYDAAHIHDHLDDAVRPSVVLMNPPFSAAAHVDGAVADAALRHVASALARVAEGGRLVAITGASFSPDHPSWREAFVRLQERGRIVFSAAVDGRVYARHGTTVETRLTVIDREPADDPRSFPASSGVAPDVATLLEWVATCVPARLPVDGVAALRTPVHPVTVRPSRKPARQPPAVAGSSLEREGTLAQTYLHSRGIVTVFDSDPLRFHPRCYYRPDEHRPTETWPALIAAVTDPGGRTTGVHRTWLDRSGQDKAPIDSPRRAMGHLLGHGVRFGVADDVMAAGEGIETMLSLRSVLPTLPMVAALSANHLAALLLPPTLRRLYVARDTDPAGDAAMASLCNRAAAAGIEVGSLSPCFDDFNEDLSRLGKEWLRVSLCQQLVPQDVERFLALAGTG